MKTYCGRREAARIEVTVDGAPLEFPTLGSSLTPYEFDWGHNGHGALTLALAILADYYGDFRHALRLHTDFAHRFLASLSRDDGWRLTSSDLRSMLEELEGH